MSISFDKAMERLKHRTDIILCKENYNGWSSVAKFYDLEVKEYFYSIPRNVLRQNSAHPNRGAERRKKTLIEKYGVDNALKSKQIQQKIKLTNITKYGFEHAIQNKIIKNKAIKTLQEKYNIDNPAKLSSKRIIKETGEYLVDWYKNQPEPKPGYSTLIHEIKNSSISLIELTEIFNLYKTNKTKPEQIFESLFNVKHYNCFPKNNINYKPDFKLSETVYVNVDGLYWHSEKIQKKKYYHFNLRKKFEDNNMIIFQFRENELFNKSNIIKSIINKSLGQIENEISTNKCKIQIIDQEKASLFLDENDLKGKINAKHIGLYYNDILISLLSYNEINKICMIERFCILNDVEVIEGFPKLLKHLESNLLKPSTAEIHNLVDLRYDTGKHLKENGFKLIEEKLGWEWTDYKNTFKFCNSCDNLENKKLYKIYDAGQKLYVKKRK